MAAKKPTRNRAGRVNLGSYNLEDIKFPNLIKAQVESFDEFKNGGIQKLFKEISPIKDPMERMWTLDFKDFRMEKPSRSVEDASDKGLTYSAPVYATAQLLNNKTGEIKEQEIFVTDLPMMTKDGFFVINGVRRVVMHQIIRAEGVLFDVNQKLPGRKLYSAKIMPTRGRWYEFETNRHNVITTRLVYKRPKVLFTQLLRVFGYETDEEIRELFKDVDTHEEHKFIEATLARDFTRNKEEAIIKIYDDMRPEENVTLETAEKYIKGHFFSERRFELGKVGRYQLNKKLGTDYDLEGDECRLHVDDIILTIKNLIKLHNGQRELEDVDSLSNRRIRSVGEVLIDQLRVGTRRIEKNVRDKMSMYGEESKLTPSMLISTKPFAAAIMTFFGSNQLSMFMDQANILSEMENKRKLTAAGPGGLTKERASFSVREVHNSHYSRLDPITSPDSQSIGVVKHLALFSRVNEYGFLEAPFYKIETRVDNDGKSGVNRILAQDVEGVAEKGTTIDKKIAEKLKKESELKDVEVKAFVVEEKEYLDADTEMEKYITNAAVERDEYGNLVETIVPARNGGTFVIEDVQNLTHIDMIPSQQAGVGMSLIPFVHHDDTKRALTGSNQQRQAVPLLKQQAPRVGTGYEEVVAKQSGWGIFAEDDGFVKYVDADKLVVIYGDGNEKEYKITKFHRSNYDTAFSQKPKVELEEEFKKGDLLIDGPTMVNGELALGTNIRAAMMFYDGYNYEDSVLISDRIVKDDILTSVHIKEHSIDLRDTELGPEVLTADIPHVSENILANLDSQGVVRVGARVTGGDILSGVVAPRGEEELTAEERLLRAIFGQSASEVRDNSLRVPHGSKGIVVRTQILSVENDDKLRPGVLKQVKVWVAETKKISYGDKLSGRHGDKSTIAAIRPVEDMPFTADGEPIDIVLTPTFIKRMNMGQALEVHYGRYAELLGIDLALPLFEKANDEWLKNELEKNGFNMDEKVEVYDGRTGEKFPRKIAVGMKYVMKLKHIADEKVNARSTGPYTLVTQQPLGGKAQMGGQRFGEMEVWALEAHGTPYALQEMLTIKSDDVHGRAQAYKAIIHGEKIENVNIPESFKVLIKELNALCINMNLISNNIEETNEDEEEL